MSVCNVFFSVKSGGQFSTYQKQGNIESKQGAHRVSFSLEKDGGLAYVFSVFKNKVMLSAVGDVSYSFTLREREVFNFILNTIGAPIHASVNCKNLSVFENNNIIQILAKYVLDMGGNIVDNELKLKVEIL